MEHRKIQKTGGSTYIVSLPNKWVRKLGLARGSEIAIIGLDNNDLLIRADVKGESKKTRIDIKKDMDVKFIIRLLITKYIQGYDTIHIVSREHIHSEIRKKLKETTQLLMGLEIFGDNTNELIFQILLRQDIELQESIYKMCDISLSSLIDMEKYFDTFDQDLAKGIIQRDSEVDKFYFLVLRQLSTKAGFLRASWMQIASNVERLSDRIENIVELCSHVDREILRKDKRIAKSCGRLKSLYIRCIDALKNKNASKANDILNEIEILEIDDRKQIDELLYKKTDPHIILIYNNFNSMGEHISEIGEATVNLF